MSQLNVKNNNLLKKLRIILLDFHCSSLSQLRNYITILMVKSSIHILSFQNHPFILYNMINHNFFLKKKKHISKNIIS